MAREKTWQPLVAVADLEPGDVTPVTFKGRDLAVYDGRDQISVSFARCTHGAANLCDGYFDGRTIECPLHQGLFDAVTGSAKSAPARVALRMIECRTREGIVEIFF